MKIAYTSDLHLDAIPSNECARRIDILNGVKADYLIMAGDICEMKNADRFLPLIKPNVKKVIVVKGNHEFYHTHLGYGVEYPENFVCLEVRQPFVVDGVAFVGDTLWSFVPIGRMTSIEYFMNDYALIADKHGDEITCSDTNALHEKQKAGLLVDCYEHSDKQIVMVTHHSPSYNGVSPKFATHPANCAFHSDAIEMFSGVENIKVWVHGHTHDEIAYKHKGIDVLCNPAGYHGERGGFEIKYFEIDNLNN